MKARQEAGHHGLLERNAHSPGPKKRGPDVKTSYHT